MKRKKRRATEMGDKMIDCLSYFWGNMSDVQFIRENNISKRKLKRYKKVIAREAYKNYIARISMPITLKPVPIETVERLIREDKLSDQTIDWYLERGELSEETVQFIMKMRK